MEKEKVFVQARVTPAFKKQLTLYAVQHDTTVQRIIEDYVQTLVELDIPPDSALTAIREHAKKPGT